MDEPSQVEDLPRRRQAELAAFADGRLRPGRTRLIEAAVAESPHQREAVARQRRAIAAVRGADALAPAGLRERLYASAHPPRSSGAIGLAASLAAGAIIAAVALALTLPGDVEGGPTIVQAAALGSRPPTAAPPSPDSQRPNALGQTVAGLAFPNWAPRFGWLPTGRRTDRLGGRRVVTVFYERAGRRLAYAIVDGPPLPPPVATTDEIVEGTRIRSFLAQDRAVLTFLREGRTCLLSEDRPDPDVRELFALAGWRGKGQVRF